MEALLRDFNPRSPHGERRWDFTALDQELAISIHAPRTGSDELQKLWRSNGQISIHAPRTGSDEKPIDGQLTFLDFNPRSPHGERPHQAVSYGLLASNFNPRSPHGERRTTPSKPTPARYFNPRSPHGERPKGKETTRETAGFQSTLPARGATTR